MTPSAALRATGRLGDWAVRLGESGRRPASRHVEGWDIPRLDRLAGQAIPRCEEEPLAAPKQGDVDSAGEALSTGTLGETRVRTRISSRLQIQQGGVPPR